MRSRFWFSAKDGAGRRSGTTNALLSCGDRPVPWADRCGPEGRVRSDHRVADRNCNPAAIGIPVRIQLSRHGRPPDGGIVQPGPRPAPGMAPHVSKSRPAGPIWTAFPTRGVLTRRREEYTDCAIITDLVDAFVVTNSLSAGRPQGWPRMGPAASSLAGERIRDDSAKALALRTSPSAKGPGNIDTTTRTKGNASAWPLSEDGSGRRLARVSNRRDASISPHQLRQFENILV